jgi:hypothetical protein
VACLGALEYSPFRDIPRLVDELAVEKLPHSHEQMSGFMLRYRFRLRQIDESLMPLIKMFFTQLQLLIDSWVFDTVVELRVETSDGECKIDFK